MEPFPRFSARLEETKEYPSFSYPDPVKVKDRYWLHLLLFILTLISTAFMGGQFAGRVLVWEQEELLFMAGSIPVTWSFILDGLRFAGSLLLFLTVHEFGHYFAARKHRIDTSLPYYIPSPYIGIGTLGAVIRIREIIPNLRKLFDIGVAGPLAGFVVALGVLLYALATLPPPTYLYDLSGHETIQAYIRMHGTFPPEMLPDPELEGQRLIVGQTLLFWLLSQFFANVPPMYEMYHYPLLFAGWLGLFFTALNLLPVGQLDGGHILYALVGSKWHNRIAQGFVVLIMTSMAIDFAGSSTDFILMIRPSLAPYAHYLDPFGWFLLTAFLYLLLYRIFQGDHRTIAPVLLGIILVTVLAHAVGPVLTQFGYLGWFVWCLLLIFLVKVEHPPVLNPEPLTPRRRLLAYFSMVIFILCFSFKPLYFV